MKEQLITFETAKLAKEKGFKEMVANHYTTELVMPKKTILGASTNGEEDKVSAPTQSLLQKWLREEHNIHIESALTFGLRYSFKVYKGIDVGMNTDVDTYEEALEKGLYEALKLIEL